MPQRRACQQWQDETRQTPQARNPNLVGEEGESNRRGPFQGNLRLIVVLDRTWLIGPETHLLHCYEYPNENNRLQNRAYRCDADWSFRSFLFSIITHRLPRKYRDQFGLFHLLLGLCRSRPHGQARWLFGPQMEPSDRSRQVPRSGGRQASCRFLPDFPQCPGFPWHHQHRHPRLLHNHHDLAGLNR